MEPTKPPRPLPDPGKPIIVTGGDPAGIGPELVLSLADDFAARPYPVVYYCTAGAQHAASFSERCARANLPSAVITQEELLSAADFADAAADFADVADASLKAKAADFADVASSSSKASAASASADLRRVLIVLTGGEEEIAPGRPDVVSGGRAFQALEWACDFILQRGCRGLLTAPLSKEWVARAGRSDFHGHTDYLAERFSSDVLMLMHGKKFSVVPLTVHIPLGDAPAELRRTVQAPRFVALLEKLQAMPVFRDARWAFCGLNPHAGEGGYLGREEIDFIADCIADWRARGLPVEGPIPADAVFIEENLRSYRLIFGCYHDQVLVPFKAMEGRFGVNCTVGLPFPRSSPDHGTAYNIAGQGLADPTSMREAYFVLADEN